MCWIVIKDFVVGGVYVILVIKEVEGVDLFCIFVNKDGIVFFEMVFLVFDYMEVGCKDVI